MIEKTRFRQVDFDPFANGEVMLAAPSTEAQKEIWLSAQFGPDANCAFNESMSFRIRGPIDTALFRGCLAEVIDRHEVLRATFSPDGSTWMVAKGMQLDIPVIDLSAAPDQAEAEIQSAIDEDAATPFDLISGPLVRAKIFSVRNDLHHVLFTAHHIVCDGWSMAIIVYDLKKLYTIKKTGSKEVLPAPPQFSAYAGEELEMINSGGGKEAEDFWLNLYAEEVPVMDIPVDRPRPIARTFKAKRTDYDIDPEIVRKLKKTGAKYGCTFMTVLIAAFKTFLFRLVQDNAIVLGVPAAGQLATGQYHLVGHCVNLLPLISKAEGSRRFCDYLLDVWSLLLDAHRHQRYTFGTLVRKLQIPRDSSRIPLIPVVFNLDQKTADDNLEIEGVDFEVFTNPRKAENFEWYWNLVSSARGDELVVECTYNEALFDEKTIRRRLAGFEALLGAVADAPEQRLSGLDWLPEEEKERLFVEFVDTAFSYPKNQCVYDLFEANAKSDPAKIAVVFEGSEITYGELRDRSNRLSDYLTDIGVGPDVLVGIYMDRSIEMMVGLLGIVKAGGAYVPLDPDYPADRLAYMMVESNAMVLITQEKFKDSIPESKAKTVFIDSGWPLTENESSTRPARKGDAIIPGPEHPAYVIFTSGSTGNPKGVKVPHRAVTNFLCSMCRTPGMTEDDTLLAVTTLSFDIHVLELFLPLISGGKVVIAPRDAAGDGHRLLEMLDTHGVTIMQATPGTWRLMLAAGWEEKKHVKVLCGGEPFPADLAKALIKRAGSVWNMYGPTETTVWSTCQRLTDDDGPILAGRPIGNTKTYVLDANRQPLPIGVPGELYIGGDGVSHGYLNRPELTSKAFVPDWFSNKPGALLYKTGDLVKYHPDGSIEYLHRLDNQLKVRGFRIEPGEIETVMGLYPVIRQAIVGVSEFSSGDQRLIGYFEAEATESVDIAALRTFLRSKLPEYMVPQHFVAMASFPLTPAGKIDRKSILAHNRGKNDSAETYAAPETAMQAEIARVWREVLKSEKIGIRDNFFDIGGHSLLGMQVVSRLGKLYGISLSIGAIFEAPTVEQMAFLIPSVTAGNAAGRQPVQEPVPEDHEVFEF